MGKYEKLRNDAKTAVSGAKKQAAHFQEVAEEYRRVENTYSNAAVIISDLEKQFETATKLTKTDITFMFFATALQCVRQYFLTPFQDRLTDKKAADQTLGHHEEHSDRHHRYYNPSFDQIRDNPVPFDAITGSKELGLGLGGPVHREKTLGHDPILGWIFGTANIATSTLTTWDFQSYHVKTGFDSLNRARDRIISHASTGKVFSSVFDKILNQGVEGWKKIGLSISKEAVHLASDVKSKESLPIPLVSSIISPEAAHELAKFGIDTANVLNVGKQASFSILINFLISMIHGLCHDEARDGSRTLYQVRTRKILSYSNLIATASNVIAVAVMEVVGAYTGNADLMKKGLKVFDIGGLLVTIHRLISDHKFIKEVKLEFLEHEWYNVVYGEEYKFLTEED